MCRAVCAVDAGERVRGQIGIDEAAGDLARIPGAAAAAVPLEPEEREASDRQVAVAVAEAGDDGDHDDAKAGVTPREPWIAERVEGELSVDGA